MRNRSLDLFRNSLSQDLNLERWLEELDKSPWFKNFPVGASADAKWNPSCEVTETASHYKMKFDIPGVQKDQIKIDLHDNCLTVSGERRDEKKEDKDRHHFSEMFYGNFLRSFTFPTKVDPEKVEAKYENGVLNIQIPKNTPTTARQIYVK